MASAVSTSPAGLVYKINTNRITKILSPCSYVILDAFMAFPSFFLFSILRIFCDLDCGLNDHPFEAWMIVHVCSTIKGKGPRVGVLRRLWSESVGRWITIDFVCHYFWLICIHFVHCQKLCCRYVMVAL